MANAYEEALDESRRQRARLEGEVIELREQLAAATAADVQLRHELEQCRTEAAVATSELAHLQRRLAEHDEQAGTRVADLESQLGESRRLQRQAERERAAVIASLGRRARRLLAEDGAEAGEHGDGGLRAGADEEPSR